MALGAAVACPDRPVIGIQADGSAMYTISALWSYAREQADITTIVCDNGSYAILEHELSRVGAPGDGERAGAAARPRRPGAGLRRARDRAWACRPPGRRRPRSWPTSCGSALAEPGPAPHRRGALTRRAADGTGRTARPSVLLAVGQVLHLRAGVGLRLLVEPLLLDRLPVRLLGVSTVSGTCHPWCALPRREPERLRAADATPRGTVSGVSGRALRCRGPGARPTTTLVLDLGARRCQTEEPRRPR